MGVIDKNTGELRSTFEVLQDLSKAWGSLNSVEKNELAETVAGKTQRALFTAIMTNFDSAVGATEAALNSEGSAAEENAKRMDSLQGKVQQLESAWQSFARNTINSDFVKNILSAVTGLIKFADSAGGLVPILTTLGSALAIFKAGSLAKGIADISSKFTDFKKNISDLGGGLQAFQLVLAGVKKGEDAAKISTLGLATAAQTLMTALGVIGIVIGVATTAYNLYTNAQKEAQEASIKTIETEQEKAKKKEESIKAEEESTNKLKEELKQLKENANQDDGTKEKIKQKEEEIKKREENIQKMKDEKDQALDTAEAEARSLKVGGAGKSFFQSTNFGKLDVKTANIAAKEMKKVNEETKDAESNAVAYNRVLEEQRKKYNDLANSVDKNSDEGKAYDAVVQSLNDKISKNSDAYNDNLPKVEKYYDLLKERKKYIG